MELYTEVENNVCRAGDGLGAWTCSTGQRTRFDRESPVRKRGGSGTKHFVFQVFLQRQVSVFIRIIAAVLGVERVCVILAFQLVWPPLLKTVISSFGF